MKITNANDPGERGYGIVRGHTGHSRAGSSGIGVRDGDGTVANEVISIEVIGGTVYNLGGGRVQIVIDTPADALTQEEADDLYLTRGTGELHVADTLTPASTATLDLATANTFDVTLTEACTFTFTNPPGSGVGGTWTIILRGEFDVTWPGEVQWRDTDGTGTTTPPTMSGEQNVVVLTTLDGGGSYGASLENGSNGGSTGASDPATDTAAWMPLTTYVGGDLVLVADGSGGGPIPTLVPIS